MNYSRLCGGIFLSLLLSMSADVSAFSFFSKKAPVVAPVKKEVAVQTVSPKKLNTFAQQNFFRAHPTMTKWLIGGGSALAVSGAAILLVNKYLASKKNQPNGFFPQEIKKLNDIKTRIEKDKTSEAKDAIELEAKNLRLKNLREELKQIAASLTLSINGKDFWEKERRKYQNQEETKEAQRLLEEVKKLQEELKLIK